MRTRTILVYSVLALSCSVTAAWAQVDPPDVPPTVVEPDADAPAIPSGQEGTIDVATAPSGAGAEAESSETPELDKFRTPDSPAFVILGVSPSEIQKPATPRELAVALSAFVDDEEDLKIPDNLAIEVAPYWLGSHARLTFDEYMSTKLGAQALRNLSVSFGTHGGEDVATKNLGVGFRTHVGFNPPDLTKCKAFDEDLVKLARAMALAMPDAELDALRDAYAGKNAEFLAELKRRKEAKKEHLAETLPAMKATLAEKFAEVREACAGAAVSRTHILSVAGALKWDFADATGDEADLVAQAYWLTYAYTASKHTSILVVGRVRADEARHGWDTFLDGGVRAIVARDRYAGSLELIHRTQVVDDDDDNGDPENRIAATAEVMVRDGTWLSISFGKDFANGELGGVFSVANLTWGMGDPKVSPPE